VNDDHPDVKKYTMISSSSEEDVPASMEKNMEENEELEVSKKFSPIIIVGGLLVAVLIIVGLFLPPISLGQRLGLGGNGAEDVAETVAEETAVSGINISAANATVSQLDETEGAAAAAAIPAGGVRTGNLFAINYEGEAPVGSIALTIPADAGSLRTLDLYGWDGSTWQFIPSQIDSTTQQIVADDVALPQAVAMLQMGPASSNAVGAEWLASQEMPAAVLPQLTEVSAGPLTLVGAGELQGEVTAVPTGAYDQFLRVTNTGAVVDQESLAALLNDTAAQENHINALVQQVAAGSYAGLNLDYQGVPSSQSLAFSTFVDNLAAALHAQGAKLAVTLATPQRTDTSWDTGGQDWSAIGKAADIVYLQMPLNPTVYSANGVADQLINFAARQVNRQKLAILTSVSAVDNIGESFLELPNSAALANFGELQFVQGGEEVEPGSPIEVALSGTASPLEWDGASLTYKYSYEQAGQTHNVWLGNEAALSQRLALTQPYNLRGVAVRGLGNVSDGTGYAAAISNYLGQGEAPAPSGAAIVWTVKDGADSVLASSSGEALSFTWDGSEQPGEYAINVEFALGDNVAELGSLAVAVAEPVEEVVEEVEEEAAPDTAVSAPAEATGSANATVNTGANVRVGPGLAYGTIAGGANAGARVEVIGRSSDSNWLNIIMPDGETEGWIFSTLLDVDPGVSIADLPVPDVALVVASNDESGGGSDTTPVTVPVAPITNSGFELGGQIFGAPYGMMSYAGMTWVKRQIKWSPGTSPDAAVGMIAEAHNAGMKILLSIPGQVYPSQLPDFAAYTEFLRGVASLPDPPNAIEVWNEMNIDAEWPPGQISASSYVNNMLAPAYNAIKSANSNIMVISGAPAPTGFFGGCSGGGCDDGLYMAAMAAAGGASYMDCIGIHYNEGIISPNQQSGDPRTDHYTRYFWGMVNTYWNAFGGARPLCFTELGYLTPEGYGSLPGGFAWAGNVTAAQQAQWLAEAASLSAGSGKVRMMIVWNVDSTTWTSDPQAGYAIIRPGGGCPACETLRGVMGN
jgi:hypothetical protein